MRPALALRPLLLLLAAVLSSGCGDASSVSSDGGATDGGAADLLIVEGPPREVVCTRGAMGPGLAAVQHCGPDANRVHWVLIGDGYTHDEMPAWAAHVSAMTSRILGEARPYERYRNFINVLRVDVESRQSGIDDPAKGVFVDTALDGNNGCIDWMKGLCQVDWAKTHAAINQATPGLAIQWRHVVLHTTIFLGATHYPAAGTLAVYPSDVPESFLIATHEGGHGFHRLGDEYVNGGFEMTRFAGAEPSWPNLTADPAGAKWRDWIGFSQPELGGPVGAYEGGLVTSGLGVYRPSKQSRMNDFHNQLDAIGKERVIQSIYDVVRPVDDARAMAGTISDCAPLWLRVVDPAVVRVQWSVDGAVLPALHGEQLPYCALGLRPGLHTIAARAYDEALDHAFSDNAKPHPLDLVRRGRERLEQTLAWTVETR